MSDIDKPLPVDTPNVTLTIRLLMTGKEVGSIIGKGGEIINSIREESGAKIHISDGAIPERIVTVTGPTESIFKSFNLICKKLEDDGSGSHKSDSGSSSGKGGSVTLRLIVPASQCGSLIGKGGSKIKEIREITSASVVVASEMLPNSTERTVTISGICSAISQCIYHICCVMLESPPKGTTIPYSPKSNGLGGGLLGMGSGNSRGGRGNHQENPLASLLGLGSGASTLAAIATLAGSQLRDRRGGAGDREDSRGGGSNTQTHEMSIPNDMIGCIIGKGGSKIAEIRQLSGAMIRISKSDESGSGRGDRQSSSSDSSERQISISGNADSVALAKSLINMSLDLHKSRMEERDTERSSGNYSMGGGNAANLGLAQLLAKPEALTSALNTLASLSSLGGLAGLGALGGGGGGNNVHVTGVHRQRGGYSGNGGSRGRDEDRGRDSKRSKFAPY
jgi:predicted RNA-binding protein YlqC (UPF0109 family)